MNLSNFVASVTQDVVPEIFLVQSCDFSDVSSSDPPVLFYVRMVYCPLIKRKAFQLFITCVCSVW